MSSQFRLAVVTAGFIAVVLAIVSTASAQSPVPAEEAFRRMQERIDARQREDSQAQVATSRPAAPAVESESAQLYRQLSNFYTLIGKPVPPAHDRAVLERLKGSSDPQVREAAGRRLELDALVDEVQDKRDLTAETGRLQAEMAGFAVRVFLGANDNPADMARGMARENGAVQEGQRKLVEAQRLQVKELRGEQDLRDLVCANLRAATRGSAFEPKAFDIGFRAEGVTGGASRTAVIVTLDNRTGGALHNCVLITHLKVNGAKIDALQRGQAPQEGFDVGFAAGFGMDRGIALNPIARQRFAWDGERVDKGNTVFVPEWKPGTRLEACVASAFSVGVAEAAEVSLWSDEGFRESIPLPADKMVDAVNQELKDQVARDKAAKEKAARDRDAKAKAARPKPVRSGGSGSSSGDGPSPRIPVIRRVN